MVFCDGLYQAQPIHDSLIFGKPTMNMQPITYGLWKDNLMCYKLHMTMHQKNENFIEILNKMCTNNQKIKNLAYINMNCIRTTPSDPTFPYLFYKNKDVSMHKKYMLFLIPGNEILINTINEEEENHENVPQ